MRYETGRLSPDAPKRQYGPFVVLGKDSEEVQLFIGHAALNDESVELSAGDEAAVFEMGPPLRAATLTDVNPSQVPHPTCRVDVVSDISLDADEVNAMVHWRSKIEKYKRDGVAARSLKPFREYIICPHKTEALSEIGRVIYWRFSCAGLVIDCYEAAGIASVEVDAEMPEVDDAILQEAYPDIWKLEQAYQQNPDAIARRYGYEGLQDLGLDEKPWRPILPGYVFHALARADSGNPRPGPYTPSSAEERYFP